MRRTWKCRLNDLFLRYLRSVARYMPTTVIQISIGEHLELECTSPLFATKVMETTVHEEESQGNDILRDAGACTVPPRLTANQTCRQFFPSRGNNLDRQML